MKFVKFGDGWIQLEAVAQVALNKDSPGRHFVRFTSGEDGDYSAEDCKELLAAIETLAKSAPPQQKPRHL